MHKLSLNNRQDNPFSNKRSLNIWKDDKNITNCSSNMNRGSVNYTIQIHTESFLWSTASIQQLLIAHEIQAGIIQKSMNESIQTVVIFIALFHKSVSDRLNTLKIVSHFFHGSISKSDDQKWHRSHLETITVELFIGFMSDQLSKMWLKYFFPIIS